MNKTEKIAPATANPQRIKEQTQAQEIKKQDKPFREVLFETMIEQAAKRAYPNMR